jgi:hypothetical protein
MSKQEYPQNWPIEDNKHRATINLLGIMFSLYQHQNGLLYSRSNLILAIQAAGFSAGWFCGTFWGALALILAAIVTIIIEQMIFRDRTCRNCNLNLMRYIEDHLLPGNEWIACSSLERDEMYPKKIRIGDPVPLTINRHGGILKLLLKYWRTFEAGKLYQYLIFGLVIIDIILAYLTSQGIYGNISS